MPKTCLKRLVKKVTKWVLCDQMTAYLLLLMRHSQIVYENEQQIIFNLSSCLHFLSDLIPKCGTIIQISPFYESLPEKCLRYFKDMLYVFPIYGWNKAKKCLIYPWYILKISVRNAWNKPQICLSKAWYIPKIFLR